MNPAVLDHPQRSATASAADDHGAHGGENERTRVLAERLLAGGLPAVRLYGRELAGRTVQQLDEVLDTVRSGDLDTVGAKLAQLAGALRPLNLGALAGRRGVLPVVGGLVGKMRPNHREVARRLGNVNTLVQRLVGDVDALQIGLAQRIESLSDAFDTLKSLHAQLQLHIDGAEAALTRLQGRLATPGAVRGGLRDPGSRHDLVAVVWALEHRLGDLRLLQHSALQQLPLLRSMQDSSRLAIERFSAIREQALPDWLSEAERPASSDEALNPLRRAQQALMAAAQEAGNPVREALQQRTAASGRLQSLRAALVSRLGAAAK